jgi:predicted transposase/invertase (TIGR01784 family)
MRHDTFFKQILSDPVQARDFLQAVLPAEVVQQIDLSTLQLESSEHTDRRGKTQLLDLALSCQMAGVSSRLYCLLEHKSAHDKYALLQIMRYCLVVWETNLKQGEPLQPILPILFYHGKEPLALPIRFGDYFAITDPALRSYLLDFGYIRFDTVTYSNQALIQLLKDNALLQAAILTMKHIFGSSEELIAALGAVAIPPWLMTSDHFYSILNYVATSHEKEALEAICLQYDEGAIMPTFANFFLEKGWKEGRQEGMQQGVQQGVKKGESALLGRMLTLKFGALPEEVEQRLEQADCAQLEAWSERILFANSLDEVFTPPAH